ncbi:MAG: hypothetical protein WAT52_03890 [Chitinophagales bacterium]
MQTKMKIISFLLIGFSLTHCSSKIKLEEANSLVDDIDYSVNVKNQFDLNTLTAFQWDTVFIFPPYTSLQKIKDLTQIEWEGLSKTKIDSEDEYCLLMFKKDDKFIKYLLHPRGKGDFSRLGIAVLNYKSAKFNVIRKEQTNSTWYYIQLN